MKWAASQRPSLLSRAGKQRLATWGSYSKRYEFKLMFFRFHPSQKFSDSFSPSLCSILSSLNSALTKTWKGVPPYPGWWQQFERNVWPLFLQASATEGAEDSIQTPQGSASRPSAAASRAFTPIPQCIFRKKEMQVKRALKGVFACTSTKSSGVFVFVFTSVLKSFYSVMWRGKYLYKQIWVNQVPW